MELIEAIKIRHSVRRFTDRKIEGDVAAELKTFVKKCNAESGLNMQLCLDEPQAFGVKMSTYGSFANVKNYLALVGDKNIENFEEKCGYYGEAVMLKAVQLGLAGCWVGISYSKAKTACTIEKGEKLLLVIALGYGESSGVQHRGKAFADVAASEGEAPTWFKGGVEAALLAPTAMNQQKFKFILSGNSVSAKASLGFYAKTDLGIAKYHFEIGAGKDADWRWAN